MAEELHAGVSGENWWINSSRRGLMESPCSVGLNDLGSFGWPITDHLMAMKTKYSISNSVSDQSSLSFQDIVNDDQKPNQHQHSGSISIDSTLQMMGFGLSTTSSPISNFNQANLINSKEDINNNNFQSMFQEDMETKLNYRPEIGLTASLKLQNEWSTTPNSSSYSFGYSTCTNSNSNTSTSTSTSTSKLLQGPFDGESQPQQSLCNNNNNNNNNNYNKMSSTTISSSFPGLFSSNSFLRPSVPKQLQHSGFQISNNTTTVPFWNYSASNGLNDIRGASFPSSQSHFLAPTSFKEKPTFHILNSKGTRNQEIQDSRSVVKKSGNDIYQPVMKRPRIETHSPLPTFKVRKEKLGDRITALQQLVSPFGKTDTASVLQEAIDYIKFLLDQVGILSTPYLKNGASCSNINQQQEGSDNLKEPDCPKQDLKSRGLCLVPISSTFPFSNETTADFWTPTFGSSFR